MLNLRIANQAIQDLEEIWDFTCLKWSTNQADKYLSELNTAFQLLCSSPTIGKNLQLKTGSFYQFLVGSHLVFYFYQENNLFIVRVLHKNTDFIKHLE